MASFQGGAAAPVYIVDGNTGNTGITGLPTSTGQKPAAGSTSVVPASDKPFPTDPTAFGNSILPHKVLSIIENQNIIVFSQTLSTISTSSAAPTFLGYAHVARYKELVGYFEVTANAVLPAGLNLFIQEVGPATQTYTPAIVEVTGSGATTLKTDAFVNADLAISGTVAQVLKRFTMKNFGHAIFVSAYCSSVSGAAGTLSLNLVTKA